MKVLVINAGSSSLKFQLIDMENKSVLAKGNVERINEGASFLKYKEKIVEPCCEGSGHFPPCFRSASLWHNNALEN